MDVVPTGNVHEPKQTLTWQRWLDTLVGIRGWIGAYPSVYMRFDIFERISEDNAWLIGYGLLTRLVDDKVTS